MAQVFINLEGGGFAFLRGLAIGCAFAAEGARVHICDINEDVLRAITQAEASITATACDVSDRVSVEKLVNEAARTLGGMRGIGYPLLSCD